MLDLVFDSLRSFVRAFALASPGGSAFESGGVTGGIVPAMADRSVVNAVVYDEPAELEAELGDLASSYDAAAVEAWAVWLRVGDTETARMLEAAGHALDGEPMAMARELEGIEPLEPGELDLVADPTEAEVSEVLMPVYEWSSFDVAMRWYDGYHPYLARVDGRPAVTLGVHDRDGDAYVTWVGTIAEVRGRGLAGKLLRHALFEARERGCTTTTLIATKMGHPVYSRLGYRDLGRVQMWERRKPPA